MPRRRSVKDFHDLSGMRAALYCRVSHISGKKSDESKAVDEKSVDDQETEGRAWAERVGVELVEVFKDKGLSASPFAQKGRGREARPDFDRMLRLVEAGGVDVVWVWAIDRSQRDLRVFTEVRDLFQQHQVALSVNGRLHHPDDYDDWMLLGITSQIAERYSYDLSKNVRRGQKSTAEAGRPHAAAAFGYRRRRSDEWPKDVPDERIWVDKHTKQFVWQEPNLWDHGGAVDDTPAAVVREIYRRVAAGDALVRIAQDLNNRAVEMPGGGIPTPKKHWTNTTVRRIAVNPVYIGKRVYQHDWRRPNEATKSSVGPALWPPLIDEETFWVVHRKLTSSDRKQSRPAAAKSLLSCLVTCAKCGGDVVAGWSSQRHRPNHIYACVNRRCAAIGRQALDDYIEEVMIGWLSHPQVFKALTRIDDSVAAAQARADVAQARSELSQWRQAAEAGRITLAGYEAAERGLLARIAEAEQRAEASATPVELVGHIGPEAEAAWGRASNEVKRQIIRRVADITLRPTMMKGGQARWHGPTVAERVEIRPLIGPPSVTDQLIVMPPEPQGHVMVTADQRALTELAQSGPLLKTELDDRLGMGSGSIDRVLRRMQERGWVTSEPAPREGARGRRTSTLTITEAGVEALNGTTTLGPQTQRRGGLQT
jgi:site-specific DNA recombinase